MLETEKEFAGRRQFRSRKEAKQDEAQERQEARDSLSPVAQITVLDRRLGADTGAKKERARLAKLAEQ